MVISLRTGLVGTSQDLQVGTCQVRTSQNALKNVTGKIVFLIIVSIIIGTHLRDKFKRNGILKLFTDPPFWPLTLP